MKSVNGIRDVLKEEGVLTRTQFETIRRVLLTQLAVPKLAFKGSPYVAYGDRLSVQVDGLPLPALDLYENRLVKEEPRRGPRKLFATFPGIDGPIVVSVDHEPKTGELALTVPKHAIDGPVTFRFSVKEYLGPLSLMDQLVPSDDAFRASLAKYVHDKNADKFCRCGTLEYGGDAKKVLPIEPCRPRPPDDEGLPYEHLEGSGLFVVSNLVLYPHCFRAVVFDSCPICPYGAIEIDESGSCSVNVDNCRGQSFKVKRDVIDDEGHFAREEESVCWECFEERDGRFSSKCFKRRLRKVLHLSPCCCGSCYYESRLSDLSKLGEICPIPGVISVGYAVDKDICVGCMVCYENINCYHNDSDILRERVLRMVAYLP